MEWMHLQGPLEPISASSLIFVAGNDLDQEPESNKEIKLVRQAHFLKKANREIPTSVIAHMP